MPFSSGEVFAGYTIQRLLGSGGMGEVYLAQHPRLPRLDALKILSLDATGDEEFRARFNREAELAATLWHPHIVGVHDRGEFDGRLWISMDYVEGTDAGQLVEQRYRSGMPHEEVAEIVTAVAEALDFAHERRLLHRDVKPANILVTEPSGGGRRRVLLTDFGIAREADDISGLTEANMAIGTVTYAAPEQLTSRSIDGRVDQYALAATAYHLLTGAPLFNHSNRAVVVGCHLNEPPPKLSDRRPDLADLDGVLDKALAKDPNDRYPRCMDLARALSERDPDCASATRVLAPPPGPPGPPDAGVHTAPFAFADESGPVAPQHTKRLDRMTVHGTARAVHKRAAGPGSGDEEVWTFRVERYESTGAVHTVVPTELRGAAIAGPLADGDVVEVNGIWDGALLMADSVINHSARTRGRRRPVLSGKSSASSAVSSAPTAPKSRRTESIVRAAVIGVVALVAIAAVVLTKGFGLWSDGGPGPVVRAESATVFSPGGAPDHPDEAGKAIDGDPGTSWPTDIYTDATPFPAFKQGVGLLLRLPEPTALSEVTVDVPSTGTEVQIRAADSPNPASLANTTELTPSVPLEPGENRIPVDDGTETANVLVWITKLGTTDGQSRTSISDITLQAAR
ncbi:serine/threonine-protein kinase [Mycobacterium sp. IDR2000157661]|uniref:serine/threonine-protein kinase n=1 Tax=Mycobacterium sp. IDR2000157661 TaxID=2867005 RepID=UPI001EEDB6B5|nr:serine/threonine-protein kinase [Mycobacterium sp. IDR2000157661]ULE35838.1 serine/threonine protein kinase [Mycobacterium sp. IDR2000157661]